MAIYRKGQASMDADGYITGYGTNWKTALTLIRPGATIVFATNPVAYATISEIINDTSLRATSTGGAVVPQGDYVILLHDSITVDGLAQDVAETLRYYQGQETIYQEFVDFLKTFDWKKFEAIDAEVKENAAAAAASESAAKQSETNAAASAAASDASKNDSQAAAVISTNASNAASASKDAAAQSAASAKSDADRAAELADQLDATNLMRKDANLSDVADRRSAVNNLGLGWVDNDASNSLLSSPDLSNRLVLGNDGLFVWQTADGQTVPIAVASGGTGASDEAGARKNLQLDAFITDGSEARVHDPVNKNKYIFCNDGDLTWGAYDLSKGSVIPLSVSCGGTGSTSPEGARNNLGLGSAQAVMFGSVDVTSTQKLPLKETTATNGIGVNFIGDNATECSFGIENTAGGSAVFHNYTRGANNAASSNGQLIGGYGSRPWDGSAYTEHSNVSQHFLQDGTCSATNHGGWFRLLTTPLNKTMDNRRQTFATSNNGDLWIGYDVPMGTYKMEGISSGESEPLSWNGRGLKQINNSSNELNLITPRNGSNSSTVIRGNSCNGTLSSRGSSQLGDAFHVGFGGHDGNDWVGLKASIRFSPSEGFSATATGAGITFSTTAIGTKNRVDRWNISNAGVMYPGADNAYSIGNSSMRVSAVYAANGAIQTSDARLKSEVRKFTDNEIAAAKLLSQEIGIYSWLAKQAEEGEDAREHIGLTVQRAIEIMESCGLDPMHYGFICHDEWEEEDIIIGYEDDVNPIIGKKEAGDRYSFRYDQLNLFIASGIEARLSALEDKLGM